MKRLDRTEAIFTVLAYVLVGVFAILAIYPFVYTVSASISGRIPYERGEVILWPKEITFGAYEFIFNDKTFWITYSNTIFYTFIGTLYGMAICIPGAYALAKRRLLFRRQLNFLVVFTMWFNAGMIPTYINYVRLGVDNRWGIIVAFGVQAFNILLLRNYFESLPSEIEEAAIVDGADDFRILTKVFIPMSKAAIATVTLFVGMGRWNGYFWTRMLLHDASDMPLQVYLRIKTESLEVLEEEVGGVALDFSVEAIIYGMLVLSLVVVIAAYPHLQKYFVKGVNVGGVKG
ncbi:carbohydrate ABC transporter permease [Marispirochaeta aestuarii]|uniref:Sugar ABC transporter permease n=1 Tax=Marispirochaeta aestuarii TaxID=1963862 RepID=A0A1Y1RZL4_9SPIO|nr:carbohydrate ABC transporter permease [Marispirochaeta aestuarii]ORC36235.1 sugar ABC transporter permease [Marispirochaeta aestuarii]